MIRFFSRSFKPLGSFSQRCFLKTDGVSVRDSAGRDFISPQQLSKLFKIFSYGAAELLANWSIAQRSKTLGSGAFSLRQGEIVRFLVSWWRWLANLTNLVARLWTFCEIISVSICAGASLQQLGPYHLIVRTPIKVLASFARLPSSWRQAWQKGFSPLCTAMFARRETGPGGRQWLRGFPGCSYVIYEPLHMLGTCQRFGDLTPYIIHETWPVTTRHYFPISNAFKIGKSALLHILRRARTKKYVDCQPSVLLVPSKQNFTQHLHALLVFRWNNFQRPTLGTSNE